MTTPSFRLIMRKGPTPGMIVELVKPETWIGRDLGNDLAINAPEVSRKHVVLRYTVGSYVIEDLGSTNGTLINGQRLIGPHSLTAGESITLGENVELVFEAVSPDLAATTVSPVVEANLPPPVASPMPGPQMPPQAVNAAPPPPTASPAPRRQMPPQPVEATLPPPYAAPVDQQSLYPAEDELPEGATERSSRDLWLMAGCGCIVLVALALAAAVLAIEYFQLWCTFFGSLIPGC